MVVTMFTPIALCLLLLLINTVTACRNKARNNRMRLNEALAVPPHLEGAFSPEDIGNLRATFAVYDADDSGTIDKPEVQRVRFPPLGIRPYEVEVPDAFN